MFAVAHVGAQYKNHGKGEQLSKPKRNDLSTA